MATYEDINQRTPADIIRERMLRAPVQPEPIEPDLRTQREIEEASKPYIGRPNLGVRGFQQQPVSERVVPLMGPNAGPPISAMVPRTDDRQATRPPYTVPRNRSEDFVQSAPSVGTGDTTPASFQPQAPQFVPALRDQINEGIMRDFERGVDRGLPFIGGDNGKVIQSFVQPPQAQIKTDDPRQARLVSFAHQAGVDPALMIAIAGRESGFNQSAIGPTTRSGERALGDMQVMPGTFAAMNQKYGGGKWSTSNPDHLTLAGAHYLADMMKVAGGDPFKTAVAYFGGPGNIQALARGENRADSGPGRAGTPTTAYAQSIADRYAQLTGGQAPSASSSAIPVAQDATSANPLRQPVEIIRGLTRTAFDPYTQREFVPPPPGVSSDIAPLLNLPPQLAAALVGERGGLRREEVQQRGATERAGIQERGAAERTRLTTEASGDAVNRVTGRALAELIQGKPPAEQLKIIQQMTRGDKDRYQVINVPDREIQTGNPLDPVKIARGGQYIRDNQTGEFFAPPQSATPGVDKKAVRAEAEAAIKAGKSKEAVNARLKELGIQPL